MSGLPAPTGLHHLSFTVADLERSVPFYRRLGFELERTQVAEDAAYVGGRVEMAFLLGAGMRLELLAYEASRARDPLREGDVGDSHIALQVDDIEDWRRRLSAEGVRFLSEPLRNEDAGASWVFLLDPDGRRVELVELDGPDPVQIYALAASSPMVPIPGIEMRGVFGRGASINVVTLEAGAILPMHQHPHEQLGVVLEGILILTTKDGDHEIGPNEAYVVPGNVEHAGTAGEGGCVVLDVFVPARDEYREAAAPPRTGSA